jgi:glutamate N-acetyltransferase/amino-acid N-acetyltransferase
MIPSGFTFSAVNAGVKSPETTRLDMGLIFCDREAVMSGVFTRNLVKAAPVVIDMELRQGDHQGHSRKVECKSLHWGGRPQGCADPHGRDGKAS